MVGRERTDKVRRGAKIIDAFCISDHVFCNASGFVAVSTSGASCRAQRSARAMGCGASAGHAKVSSAEVSTLTPSLETSAVLLLLHRCSTVFPFREWAPHL